MTVVSSAVQLARGAAAAAGRPRTAAGGVAAFYGGSPVSNGPNSTYLDSSSAKKRRSRRLFEAGQLHDVPEHAENQVHGDGWAAGGSATGINKLQCCIKIQLRMLHVQFAGSILLQAMSAASPLVVSILLWLSRHVQLVSCAVVFSTTASQAVTALCTECSTGEDAIQDTPDGIRASAADHQSCALIPTCCCS